MGYLVFPRQDSIMTVKVTSNKLLIIAAILLKQFLVAILDKLFVRACGRNEKEHFIDHDCSLGD
jgi:hypothetical protein